MGAPTTTFSILVHAVGNRSTCSILVHMIWTVTYLARYGVGRNTGGSRTLPNPPDTLVTTVKSISDALSLLGLGRIAPIGRTAPIHL